MNSLFYAMIAGVVTFIFTQEPHPLIITNALLGMLYGEMTRKI